jgi:ADP-heptose:LPS heptosyltransferase
VLRRFVLIFHQGALGDFIVTWPLILALGRAMPQARIVVVTAAQKGALAERVLGVESADVEAGWHALFADGSVLPERPAALLAGARAIYSFLGAGDDAWTRNLRSAAPPDTEIVPLLPRPRDPIERHTSEFIAGQFATRPLEHSFVVAMLRSIAERGLLSGRAVPKAAPLVIHPGSGSTTKNYPLDRFIEVAQAVQASGNAVRFVLGEAELERLSLAELKQVEATAEVVRPATLVELLDVLRGASAYLGNDSGPSHLAGIVGVPSVVLFANDPTAWKPLGPRVSVLQSDPLDALAPCDVVAALEAMRAPKGS